MKDVNSKQFQDWAIKAMQEESESFSEDEERPLE
jgi:hypothetical protein